jgi:hypothetical protein
MRLVINNVVESDKSNSSEIRHEYQNDATNLLTGSPVPYQTNVLRHFLLYAWIFNQKLPLQSVEEPDRKYF